jgi:hypothetical protein
VWYTKATLNEGHREVDRFIGWKLQILFKKLRE